MNEGSGQQPFIPASSPKSAEVVVYLDLDGVVQHEAVLYHPKRGAYMSPTQAAGHRLFEWVHILEEALEPYPDVALVLSSTWCIRPGYAKTLKRLPRSLQSRFIGGTFHRKVHGSDPWTLTEFRETPRGLQVWADVQRRKPRQWLALDDDILDWPDWAKEHLVACEGSTGLSNPRVLSEFKLKLTICCDAIRPRL